MDRVTSRDIMIRVLEGDYGLAFMLGPLAIPFVLLGHDVNNWRISFVASVVFMAVAIMKRKITQNSKNSH